MIRLNIYKTMWQKIKLIIKAFITSFFDLITCRLLDL